MHFFYTPPNSNVESLETSQVRREIFSSSIRYKLPELVKKYCTFVKNMNTMQWNLFKQPPFGKTRDKYRLLFFMHRNEIGFSTHFTKINK